MWYAMHCRAGTEETVMNSCKRNFKTELLKDVFIFTYEKMKRYGGEWHMETEKMFPNYVFLEAEDEHELSQGLEPYREFVQVLEDKEILWNVYPEEERFLRSLGGMNHHIRMSKGVIRGGTTQVMEGPLAGMEGHIRKIDRHKRIAQIETPIHYTGNGVWAGLEIVEKC